MLKFFIIQECSTVILLIFYLINNITLLFIRIFLKIGLIPMEIWVINFIKNVNLKIFITLITSYKVIPIFILLSTFSFYTYLYLFFILFAVFKIYKNVYRDFLIMFYSTNFINFLLLFMSGERIITAFVFFMIYNTIIISLNFNDIIIIVIIISLPPTILFFLKLCFIIHIFHINVSLLCFIFVIGWGVSPYIFIIFSIMFKTFHKFHVFYFIPFLLYYLYL